MFYPTFDGKPVKEKGEKEKPSKKPGKTQQDANDIKYGGHQDHFIPIKNPYGYNENAGPGVRDHSGYYNPDTTKDQYESYNPYEQYDQEPNGIPQGKPNQQDLYNILGGGGKGNPTIPPHVRIEHILQHLQPNDPNYGNVGPVVVPYPGYAQLPQRPNSGGLIILFFIRTSPNHLNNQLVLF